MMKVVLCAEREALMLPASLGLEVVSLEGFPWLELFSEAEDARLQLSGRNDVSEVWVASSDVVEGINLAAALKRDHPNRQLYLVAPEITGSVASRAHAADIDGLLTAEDLAERFDFWRHKAMLSAVLGGDAVPAPAPAPAPASVPAPEPESAFEPEPRVASAPASSASSSTNAGFILTVVGCGGGVGKSSLAAICGALVGRRARTVLLDFDLQFGDLARLTGCDANLTVSDVIDDPTVWDRRPSTSSGVVVVSALDLPEKSEAAVSSLPRVLAKAARHFDAVIVNTGPSWNETMAELVELSSCVVFVMDQRASSVWSCRRMVDLCERCGIATGSFIFALNRCSKNSLVTPADVSCALNGVPVYELREGGVEVEEYLGSGSVEPFLETRNEYLDSVRRLLSEIVPQWIEAAPASAKPKRGRSLRDVLRRKDKEETQGSLRALSSGEEGSER